MGAKKKTVDMSMDVDEVKEPVMEAPVDGEADEQATVTKRVRPPKSRSKTYVAARRHVDRTKNYPLKKAVELVKSTSYSKFDGTVTADVIVKDENLRLEMAFPHQTGKQVKVAVADDALLEKVGKGEIDFDILLATPQMMPKIAKVARVLGPKGLMPNPKNKTVTDNPEKRKKELEAGKQEVKTERKAPLMHVRVGKTGQPEKELKENVEALIKAVGAKKMVKLTLAATMSPGIKVDLSEFQVA